MLISQTYFLFLSCFILCFYTSLLPFAANSLALLPAEVNESAENKCEDGCLRMQASCSLFDLPGNMRCDKDYWACHKACQERFHQK